MTQNLMTVEVDNLDTGMILGENIYDTLGNILLSEGIVLKESYILKLKEFGISEVRISYKNTSEINDPSSSSGGHNTLDSIRIEAKAIIEDTMKSIYLHDEANIEEIYIIVNKIIELLLSNKEVAINLSNLRALDEYTFEHSVNVCIISLFIGISMGLSEDNLRNLGTGAFLHDIGKVLIPPEILKKPGELTNEEYEIVKKHTTFGYELLRNNEMINEEIVDIILSHHERPNGEGYPKAKDGDNIHIYSRIVAVADVFHALTSDRVYKSKTDVFNALEYILNMESFQFDKNIVRAFITALGIYPLGSVVRLNTSETGKIIKVNKKAPRKPVIRILADCNGITVKEHYLVDIEKNPSVLITDFSSLII